jgi:hypothetical protein
MGPSVRRPTTGQPLASFFLPERRANQRFRSRPVVKILVRGTQQVLRGCALNVSKRGIGLLLTEPIEEGQLLVLFPHNAQLGRSPALNARVVRVESTGFASWFAGCELLRPLNVDEVRDFLS